MIKKAATLLLLSIALVPLNSASAATKYDPEGHAKLPVMGTSCSKSGEIKKNSYVAFTCKAIDGDLVWNPEMLKSQVSDVYLKGYKFGLALKKNNVKYNFAVLVCKNSADGYVVKDLEIQSGKLSATDQQTLNDYWGFMGCWDGFNGVTPQPKTLSLPDPVGPIYVTKSEQYININQSVLDLFETLADPFDRSSDDGLTWLLATQYQGAFDSGRMDECVNQRLDSNWRIVSMTPDLRTLRYAYTLSSVVVPDPASEYDSGRITTPAYSETPLLVYVWEVYHDDIQGDFLSSNWRRVIVNSDGTVSHTISPCPIEDESSSSGFSSWSLPVAPKVIKAPTGKVDKSSNAYKTMYTVGKNFAKVSLASDTAKSQCLSAMSTGLIKARGIPQYLGVQARQIQSYLSTASGFQGCLDGFGH